MREDIKYQGKYRIASARLSGYDYTREGAYFITICTYKRRHLFGDIINGRMRETAQTKICRETWFDLNYHYHNCILDEFVIMPNHVHFIVFINNGNQHKTVETGFKPVSTVKHPRAMNETGFKPVSTVGKNKLYPVSEIVRGFKTFTARRINEYQNTVGKSFWQPRYYDRIIRNDEELNRIREYIKCNPVNWTRDRNNNIS